MYISKFKRVLVIVAHPDDEVLACGGAIALHVKNGDAVTVAILSQGILSRKSDTSNSDNSALKVLRNEAEQANSILGVENVIFANFPDNALDTVPLLDIIKYIENLKNIYKPNVVYTHHHSDINIDHQLIFKAVLTAFRPIKNDQLQMLLTCEVPSSTEWQAPLSHYSFNPNYFVDISTVKEQKNKSMSQYKSELREYPHPRSLEGIECIDKRWGMVVGFEAAEAFNMIRCIDPGIRTPMFVLRGAKVEDSDFILNLRNEKVARENSRDHDFVPIETHKKWFSSKIADTRCQLTLIAGSFDQNIGIVRIDSISPNECDISVNISAEYRGMGIGSEALFKAIRQYKKNFNEVQTFNAYIKHTNHSSMKIFQRCGFEFYAEVGQFGHYKKKVI